MNFKNRIGSLSVLLAIGCGGQSAPTEHPVAATTGTTAVSNVVAETAPALEALEVISIPNAALFQGNLVGGQPGEGQYAEAARAGYTQVIDFRPETEDGAGQNQSQAEAAGMTYLRIPVAGPDDLSQANVEAFAAALGNGPSVVHCKSGNRAGAMFALKENWLDGKNAEEALASGKASGLTSLEEAVKAKLK